MTPGYTLSLSPDSPGPVMVVITVPGFEPQRYFLTPGQELKPILRERKV
jgi:hypothetical protein